MEKVVDREAADLGQWLLEELRELIPCSRRRGGGSGLFPPVAYTLVCRLAQAVEHPKLKALALIDFERLGCGGGVFLPSTTATYQ